MIRVCLAGATGWMGRAVGPAVYKSGDLRLVGAVSRTHKGQKLGEIVGVSKIPTVISGSVEEALRAKTDVLVDFTSPEVVKSNVLKAISRRVHVVVGTSGLTNEDYEEIGAEARRRRVGVLAVGNFAVSAILLEHFASIAADFMPAWEVIDYASDLKPDAPSGTARELAHALSEVGKPKLKIPVRKTKGSPVSRGLALGGTQVHSVRLPGFVIGAEAMFGNTGERLTIRYDASGEAKPYVEGVLLAIRKVQTVVGLQRGLWQFLAK